MTEYVVVDEKAFISIEALGTANLHNSSSFALECIAVWVDFGPLRYSYLISIVFASILRFHQALRLSNLHKPGIREVCKSIPMNCKHYVTLCGYSGSVRITITASVLKFDVMLNFIYGDGHDLWNTNHAADVLSTASFNHGPTRAWPDYWTRFCIMFMSLYLPLFRIFMMVIICNASGAGCSSLWLALNRKPTGHNHIVAQILSL